ncbi:MAG: hypothetical protein IJ400_05510 [Clostridia bacterium]|nr:hypothetical protein [Clostridia bacterium]
MGYKMEIPMGMLFRKMYCRHCGQRLEREKVTNVYFPGDPNFSRTMHFGGKTIINIGKQTVVTYIYKCPDCGKTATYYEQVHIARRQRKLGKRILTDVEI